MKAIRGGVKALGKRPEIDGPFPTLCLEDAPLVVAFHNALCPHRAGASFPVPLSGLRTSRIVTTIEGQHDLYRTDIVQSSKWCIHVYHNERLMVEAAGVEPGWRI